MESLLRSEETVTVSQSIDDDTESFFIVRRWDSETEGNGNTDIADEQNSEETTMMNSGSEDLSALSISNIAVERNGNSEEVPMSVSQTSGIPDGNNTNVEDAFSMTTYSTASSISDNQLEELKMTLTKVVDDDKKLKDALEKTNVELNNAKSVIEDLRTQLNESYTTEKTKSEEFRQVVQKLESERDTAASQLQSLLSTSASATAKSRTASDFEVMETLENQLKQRDIIIQQNGEHVKELSKRIAQEIVRREELQKALKKQEEENKSRCESLTSSDEALAKCFAEKEKMEGDLQEIRHAKLLLQEEISHLKDKAVAENAEKEKLQTRVQQLESHCGLVDTENQQLNIKWAALTAEFTQKIQELNEAVDQIKGLQEENFKLQQEVKFANEQLEACTTELRNQTTKNTPSMSASSIGSSIASFPGQVMGLMKRSKGYGIRDENDDPDESFGSAGFEHVQTPSAPIPTPRAQEQKIELKCPICLKRFDNVRQLEYHASNCGSDPFSGFSFP